VRRLDEPAEDREEFTDGLSDEMLDRAGPAFGSSPRGYMCRKTRNGE
jgi:hypothetical protein